ncbi:conserved hypothetical protein [Syntrophobacter sp. SbD1]|nr:conserved hypothetical protein [Syntrophobacter sp. SbD1]
MPITLDGLKLRAVDYLLASMEDGQLVFEPFCSCGSTLDQDYHCAQCGKVCDCKFVACSGAQTLGIVEKLISGNPGFRGFEALLLEK